MVQFIKSSKSKILMLVSIIILMSIPFQACTPDASGEPDQLRISVLPYASFAPLIIAQEEGFFAEENLEVEFVRMNDAVDDIPMLLQGELDAAGSALQISILNALADGDIKIVADKGYLTGEGCSYMALLASPAWVEEYSTSPADALAGAKVAIDTIKFEGFMFDKILRESGLTLADITPIDIPPPNLADAVENNSVDIISQGEPWVTRLLDTNLVIDTNLYNGIAPEMQLGVIVFGPNLLEDRPEVGVRFMKAYLKAVERYNEGKTDRNVEILAEYTQLDVDIVQRICWLSMKEDGMISTDSVDEYQGWAFSQGLIEQIIPAETYWDPSFIEQTTP